MKCSAYIATSLDGFIADIHGGVDWLDQAGDPNADMTDVGDMGFQEYIDSVDCMIMGRNTLEVLASFNLTEEQWPYGDLPIFVLSSTLTELPKNMQNRATLCAVELVALIDDLESKGFKHAYLDGGRVISSAINEGKLSEMVITQVPMALGKGIGLFDSLTDSVKFTLLTSTAFPNGFIQNRYSVDPN